jgi:hypothetical protein
MEKRTTISTYENGPFLVMGGAFCVVDADKRGVSDREGDDRLVPLWGLDEEALLRWDALEGRLYGRREGDRGGGVGLKVTKRAVRGRQERRKSGGKGDHAGGA